MLQLDSEYLETDEVQLLNELQLKVDNEQDFEKKSKKAKSIWDSKSSTYSDSFSKIREKLKEMTVSVELCNYCEQNEATDIEHIYPKSFFPEKSFKWDNFILACKTCNSGYKLDKCLVVDSEGNAHNVPRNTQPTSTVLAIINPRIEDPNSFLYLSSTTWTFDLLPNLDRISNAKAEGTIKILSLNSRSALLHRREGEAKYIFERLQKLQKILRAKDINEIRSILSPYNGLDSKLSLDELKESLKKSFLLDIAKRPHPSVWYWIRKIDSKTVPVWKSIFTSFPELVIN